MINADNKIRLIKNSPDGKRYAIYPNGDKIRTLLAQSIASGFNVGSWSIGETSWQLASGHFIPAKMSMRIVHPATSTTSSYIYENWYTGMALNLPICVQGGAWPFYYELTSAPTGMTIGKKYGDANYGRITWESPSAGSHSITVKITDQDGNYVSKTWTMSVGTSKHVFFDITNGNNTTGSGTISSPYKDFGKWASTDKFTDALNGKICVYRTGTYSTSTSDAVMEDGTHYAMGVHKPLVHIAYPNETVIFNFSQAAWWFNQNSENEVAIKGIEMRGLNDHVSGAYSAAQYFYIISASRSLVDSMKFTSISGSAHGTAENPACIKTDGTATDWAVTNCTFDGIDGFFGLEVYNTSYFVCEGNTILNGPSKQGAGGFYFKLGSVSNITVRNNTAVTNNAGRIIFLDSYSGGSMNSHEVCWNNLRCSWSEGAIIVGSGNAGSYTGRWLYRNTIQAVGSVPCVTLGTNETINVDMENNVYVHNGTYTNGILKTGYLGTLTQTNQLSSANVGYTDSSGYLSGTYRTTYLGINGWEVA